MMTWMIPPISRNQKRMVYSVGLMELMGGNVDITGMPPREFPLDPLDDGFIG